MSTVAEFHEEEALGKAYDSRLMRRLLTYLRPHRKAVVIEIAETAAGISRLLPDAPAMKRGRG